MSGLDRRDLLVGALIGASPLGAPASAEASPNRSEASASTVMRFEISSTVSPQARAALAPIYAFYGALPKSGSPPADLEAWDRQNAMLSTIVGPLNARGMADLPVDLTDDALGGVKVLRVTPRKLKHPHRTILYAHGGSYVHFSARTVCLTPALMAATTGCEVVSVDYTLAPRSTWKTVPGEVEAVYRALLDNGRAARAMGFFGDSAGGGLVAGTILRLRDRGLPLPGAQCLWSPWSDLTATGDTYQTLAAADPALDETTLDAAAAVYVPNADERKHPYASPVYGNYAAPYPPTLIQGGTREIFLSHFVRHYQAIIAGGGEAVLDLYEGMPHVFQSLAPNCPETRLSLSRAYTFFERHLA